MKYLVTADVEIRADSPEEAQEIFTWKAARSPFRIQQIGKPHPAPTPYELAVYAAIERWHMGDGEEMELHEYLGWTWDEYSLWVEQGVLPPEEPTIQPEWIAQGYIPPKKEGGQPIPLPPIAYYSGAMYSIMDVTLDGEGSVYHAGELVLGETIATQKGWATVLDLGENVGRNTWMALVKLRNDG